MSITFTKLFSSITESTVWCESDQTRIVWICMLAMADQHGRIWGSIPGLANRARVPVEAARAAIDRFLAPDPDSRTKLYDGRRIAVIDGGWRLLNYEKFRELRDDQSRREQNRIAQQRWRDNQNKRQSEKLSTGINVSKNVSKSAKISQKSAQAEAEAEAEAEYTTSVELGESAERGKRGSRLPDDWQIPAAWETWSHAQFPAWTVDTVRSEAAKFADYWHAKAGANATKVNWFATWRNWCRNARPAASASASSSPPNPALEETSRYLDELARHKAKPPGRPREGA